MVLGVLGAVAGLVKCQISSTKVDSKIFRLHYQWTTAFLFGCTAFLAASEYFGDPIKCSRDEDALTTFCWISGIFTLRPDQFKGIFVKIRSFSQNLVVMP